MFVLLERRSSDVSAMRSCRGYTRLVFPGRTVLLAPNPARPSPAAPPGAPTRPARGMSGFWIRQVDVIGCASSVWCDVK